MDVMLCGTTCRRRRDACASGPHHVSRPARRCPRRHGGDPSEPVAVGRYYDPQTGQFLSVDPEVQQTLEAFLYAGDDPVKAVDPLGTTTVSAPGDAAYAQCGDPDVVGFDVWEICERINWAGIVGPGRVNRDDFLMGLGIAAGIVSIVSGIGVLDGIAILGMSATDLATVSTVASLTAGLTDAPKCATGTGNSKLIACFDLMTSPLGGVLGISGRVLGLGEYALRAGALVSLWYGGATIVFHYAVSVEDGITIVGRGSKRNR
jgi:hypothetical protein